jgi:hypothetical protein
VLGYVSVEPWDPTRRVFPLQTYSRFRRDVSDVFRRLSYAQTRSGRRKYVVVLVLHHFRDFRGQISPIRCAPPLPREASDSELRVVLVYHHRRGTEVGTGQTGVRNAIQSDPLPTSPVSGRSGSRWDPAANIAPVHVCREPDLQTKDCPRGPLTPKSSLPRTGKRARRPARPRANPSSTLRIMIV